MAETEQDTAARVTEAHRAKAIEIASIYLGAHEERSSLVTDIAQALAEAEAGERAMIEKQARVWANDIETDGHQAEIMHDFADWVIERGRT